MAKTAVVAMSTSGLDNYPHPHNIRILRLHLIVDGKNYIDGKTITTREFQQWMLNNPDKLASTSPPTRLEMTRFFLELQDEGVEEVLFVAMSSALSKTYQHVLDMQNLFEGKMKIHAFDTKTGTFTEGMLALEADKCLRKGWPMSQVLSHLHDLRDSTHILFGVEDLTHLLQNGRLTVASAFVANLLRIKPIIEVNPLGQAVVADKVMTMRRTMNVISDRLRQYQEEDNYIVFTLYSGNMELHRELEGVLKERNRLNGLPAYPISPVVAAHCGPHACGIGLIKDSGI